MQGGAIERLADGVEFDPARHAYLFDKGGEVLHPEGQADLYSADVLLQRPR